MLRTTPLHRGSSDTLVLAPTDFLTLQNPRSQIVNGRGMLRLIPDTATNRDNHHHHHEHRGHGHLQVAHDAGDRPNHSSHCCPH